MIKTITFKNVLTFTLPSISLMVFMSLYTMVDGIFVANLIGTKALSAINIILPMITVFMAVGTMLGTGGNAICARLLGEGKSDEAKRKLTLFSVTGLTVGIIITVFTQLFLHEILEILGATEETYQYCYDYFIVLSLFAPCAILQVIFENAMIASGKPQIAFVAIVCGGLTNLVLDYVFIVYFGMGMTGVALATGIGLCLPTLIGLYFFSTKKAQKSLHFKMFSFDIKAILQASGNGSSEMVAQLASGATTYLFNITMLKMAGTDGVAAITVVLYAQLLINTLFIGFSMGIAPVISYYFGALNKSKLRKLFTICIKFISISSVALVIIAFAINETITGVFLEKGTEAYDLTVHGFYIFSFGFLFAGINIFASGLFTAYSNGKVSALVSFLRTFLFISISILVLPQLIGLNGVWLAVPIAEFLSFFMAVYFFVKYKERYMYDNKPRAPRASKAAIVRPVRGVAVQ